MFRLAPLLLAVLALAGAARAQPTGLADYVLVDGPYTGIELTAFDIYVPANRNAGLGAEGTIKRGECGGAYFAGHLLDSGTPTGPCGLGRVVPLPLPSEGPLRDYADAITEETWAIRDTGSQRARDIRASLRALKRLAPIFRKGSAARNAVAHAIAPDRAAMHAPPDEVPPMLNKAISAKRTVFHELIARGLIELPAGEFSETKLRSEANVSHNPNAYYPTGKPLSMTLAVRAVRPLPGATRVAGPDGREWFITGNAIGAIGPGGKVIKYTLPESHSRPMGITAAYGSIWFTTLHGNTLGRIDRDGKIKEWPLPTANSGPSSIAPSAGRMLAIVESRAQKLAWFRVG